jgi:hypothetical protein
MLLRGDLFRRRFLGGGYLLDLGNLEDADFSEQDFARVTFLGGKEGDEEEAAEGKEQLRDQGHRWGRD